MKINQDIRLNTDKIRSEQKAATNTSLKFNELVQKQDQKMQIGQLQNLLKDIESAGERLSRSRTFKDLSKYKTLVKRFVKEAVDFGMDLKQSHSWNQYGQGRSLKIVETIDEKLVELTEGVLEKEGNSIDLLGKIGEIKGLLINLYT
ncbi:YaaR family protein [Robertmurraya korlensis]|uniref:YaaR family protein n=1 Tax=Robertmurraya korlensis TaxID=519977 RepID=UPI00203F5C66|nr:YaaR family protein [Robertmurraya korlensis]MCM3603667.1 YaaR family protein [Robertmurraya korlensis]